MKEHLASFVLVSLAVKIMETISARNVITHTFATDWLKCNCINAFTLCLMNHGYDTFSIIGRFVLLIRWWLCEETLENLYEINMKLKVSFKFELVPYLYRCPDGYYFDMKIRRCQRKDVAVCGSRFQTTTIKPTYEDVGLLQLLF